ncbi:MAG TPA: NAD(P)-dependent oxidoreductase [Sphingomonas sp.]|jgi:nucleoside-diphosphate-sugar epimerase|nr:NAD(P)-dependent oxidoreductase [Sphingomonas sp.]
MPETVLIFGGSGFIGSHLAARHLKTGDSVHVAVRPGWNGQFASPVTGAIAHEVDLGASDQIEDCFTAARPTLVYHLASRTGHGPNGHRDPFSQAWLDDAANLIRLLDAAMRVRPALRSFVRIGSLAEYGEGPVPSREDQREEPSSPYALAQATATRYIRLFHPGLPFPVLTARLGLTYGPGQSAAFLIPSLIRSCLDRQPYLVRDPFACRDLIHVDDVATGLMRLALSSLPSGEIINICSGEALANRRAAEIVCDVTGAPPDLVTYGAAGAPSALSSIMWGSAERARTLLHWSARLAFADGIRRTIGTLTARSYA